MVRTNLSPKNTYGVAQQIFKQRSNCFNFGVKNAEIKQVFFTEQFADMMYKQSICNASKNSHMTIDRLRSVVGPQELKRVVIENTDNRRFWVPGERPDRFVEIPDSNGIENVISRNFGASIHIHTKQSDGVLHVGEVLEQAVKYADLYAKKGEGRFIVGITDHNTIEGCKDAVNILASNPEKYKNLGVVLGAEISTKEKSLGQFDFRKPEKLHILSLCINPFDKNVGSFFKGLVGEYGNPMFPNEITVKEAINGLGEQRYGWFSLAHPAFPDLTHRVRADEDHCEAVAEVIKHFKNNAKDKALYVENYYSAYYGHLQTDKALHKKINKTCDALSLYKAGGIDVHGDSIFYSSPRVKRGFIA